MDKLFYYNSIIQIMILILLIVILLCIFYVRTYLNSMSNYDLSLLCNNIKSNDYKLMTLRKNFN